MSRFDALNVSDNPRGIALVTCDRILIDQVTKNKSLIDIFDTLTFPQLPAGLFRLSIYAAVARGTSDTAHLCLGLFAPSGAAIMGSTMTIENWGAGQADFVYELNGVMFSEEGIYDLRLFDADHLEHVVAQRRLVVQTAPPPPQEEAHSPTP
jgi:hypothetical protein